MNRTVMLTLFSVLTFVFSVSLLFLLTLFL